MSYEFYIQQRFFSVIELAQENFVSVDFGPYLNSASNVIIKNGILNCASHHAIHGSGVSNIVNIKYSCIEFWCCWVQILNCEIDPSSLPVINGR